MSATYGHAVVAANPAVARTILMTNYEATVRDLWQNERVHLGPPTFTSTGETHTWTAVTQHQPGPAHAKAVEIIAVRHAADRLRQGHPPTDVLGELHSKATR